MAGFLNLSVFFFISSSIIAAITGHKDTLVLSMFAAWFVMLRAADYVGEKLSKRG